MMPKSDKPLADGYYLSTYLTEPGAAFLLSTATRHDNSVSLWRKEGESFSSGATGNSNDSPATSTSDLVPPPWLKPLICSIGCSQPRD
jgi:hypothetical protein